MSTFAQADSQYRAAVLAPGRELEAAFEAARALGAPKLDGDELTEAVLLRLQAYVQCQAAIKSSLNKVYAAPAADFFVETIVFYLQVAFDGLGAGLHVASERNIEKRSGSLRPDITIWKDTQLIAAVECKTQLGWNRDGWTQDFEEREAKLEKVWPKARLLLLVMTASNWSGFGEDNRVGRKFFVLLRDRLLDMRSYHSNLVVHRLEELIASLLHPAEA